VISSGCLSIVSAGRFIVHKDIVFSDPSTNQIYVYIYDELAIAIGTNDMSVLNITNPPNSCSFNLHPCSCELDGLALLAWKVDSVLVHAIPKCKRLSLAGHGGRASQKD
jgi:hypothetical protein